MKCESQETTFLKFIPNVSSAMDRNQRCVWHIDQNTQSGQCNVCFWPHVTQSDNSGFFSPIQNFHWQELQTICPVPLQVRHFDLTLYVWANAKWNGYPTKSSLKGSLQNRLEWFGPKLARNKTALYEMRDKRYTSMNIERIAESCLDFW